MARGLGRRGWLALVFSIVGLLLVGSIVAISRHGSRKQVRLASAGVTTTTLPDSTTTESSTTTTTTLVVPTTLPVTTVTRPPTTTTTLDPAAAYVFIENHFAGPVTVGIGPYTFHLKANTKAGPYSIRPYTGSDGQYTLGVRSDDEPTCGQGGDAANLVAGQPFRILVETSPDTCHPPSGTRSSPTLRIASN